MKITEILEIEKTNTGSINLFKEGICWKAFEKSAFKFVKNIKEYRIFRKYIKAINQDIAYLAFPESVLQEVLKTVEKQCIASSQGFVLRKSENFIEIQGFTDTDGFEEWKARIEVTTNNIEKSKELKSKIDELIKLIQQSELRMQMQMEKLQKTLFENSEAINAININLTNLVQSLSESSVISH